MERRVRPAGKLVRVIDQTPVESTSRPGRKLFAVHKNMQSFGFIIGTDSVAKQYFEKVSRDLQERYQSLESKTKPREEPVDDRIFLRQELQKKEAELRTVKKSYQALIRVNREDAQTERSPSSTMVDAEVETEATGFLPKRTRPLRYESPLPRAVSPSSPEVDYPFIPASRYTRKHPKPHTDNPILGYGSERSQMHRRERSFADYGTMVLR